MSAAAVIIEDSEGRVLLLLRGPTAPWMPGRWDLPGGMIEAGETPRSAAVREAREETGLHVHEIVPLTRSRGDLTVLYARRWSGQVRLNDEHSHHAWVSIAEVAHWDVVPTQRETLRLFALSRR